MVIRLMQSISGDNYGTYTSYMVHLMTGMLGMPCRPCLGPRQLKFGRYQLVVTILGVLGMALFPIFFYRDFCT